MSNLTKRLSDLEARLHQDAVRPIIYIDLPGIYANGTVALARLAEIARQQIDFSNSDNAD